MNKYHLIDWDTACSPIQSECMGVKELCTFDQAQLGKQLGRYATEWRHFLEGSGGEIWKRVATQVYDRKALRGGLGGVLQAYQFGSGDWALNSLLK